MLYTQAKNITLKNFELFSKYETFMSNSSQEEFSKSQIPFYHAVKAFPRILCYLASMIEDSETRLHIAENIWEEHGTLLLLGINQWATSCPAKGRRGLDALLELRGRPASPLPLTHIIPKPNYCTISQSLSRRRVTIPQENPDWD